MHPFLDGLVIVMIGSGIGMAVLAGLPAIVFGGHGHLPARFDTLPLHSVHAMTARLLVAALVLHVGGALFHHFILRDGLLSRMGLASAKAGG
jgi:cytochrome b561